MLTPNLIQSRIIDAETKNNTINPQGNFEFNQKIVNSIILTSVARGRSEFTNDEILDLQMVASQCPFTGGPAVYEARSLLLLTDAELLWEDDIICTGSSARHAATNNFYSFVGIFPNPASEKITIQYDLSFYSNARMEILDAQGRKLSNQNIDTKDYSLDINISNLMNGVYFINLFSDENLIRVEKFTVIK